MQMSEMVSSFKYEEYNPIMQESLEEYVLASSESAYEDPEEQAPMIFTDPGVELHYGKASHLQDQKQP